MKAFVANTSLLPKRSKSRTSQPRAPAKTKERNTDQLTMPVWEWQDDVTTWTAFLKPDRAKIEELYISSNGKSIETRDLSWNRGFNTLYRYDFGTMRQVNTESKKTRQLRRRLAPCCPKVHMLEKMTEESKPSKYTGEVVCDICEKCITLSREAYYHCSTCSYDRCLSCQGDKVKVQSFSAFEEWHRTFRDLSRSQVDQLSTDVSVRAQLERDGLQVIWRQWLDNERKFGSEEGKTTTDITLFAIPPQRLRSPIFDDRQCINFPVVRAPNYSDEVDVVPNADGVVFDVKNRYGHLVKGVTLRQFLAQLGQFIADLDSSDAWSDPIDDTPLQTSSQFSIIPSPSGCADVGIAAFGQACRNLHVVIGPSGDLGWAVEQPGAQRIFFRDESGQRLHAISLVPEKREDVNAAFFKIETHDESVEEERQRYEKVKNCLIHLQITMDGDSKLFAQGSSNTNTCGRGNVCPNGHNLSVFLTPHDGYLCDKCNTKMPSGAKMFGCRPCDFDHCVDCWRSCAPKGTPEPQVQVPYPGGAPCASASVGGVVPMSTKSNVMPYSLPPCPSACAPALPMSMGPTACSPGSPMSCSPRSSMSSGLACPLSPPTKGAAKSKAKGRGKGTAFAAQSPSSSGSLSVSAGNQSSLSSTHFVVPDFDSDLLEPMSKKEKNEKKLKSAKVRRCQSRSLSRGGDRSERYRETKSDDRDSDRRDRKRRTSCASKENESLGLFRCESPRSGDDDLAFDFGNYCDAFQEEADQEVIDGGLLLAVVEKGSDIGPAADHQKVTKGAYRKSGVAVRVTYMHYGLAADGSMSAERTRRFVRQSDFRRRELGLPHGSLVSGLGSWGGPENAPIKLFGFRLTDARDERRDLQIIEGVSSVALPQSLKAACASLEAVVPGISSAASHAEKAAKGLVAKSGASLEHVAAIYLYTMEHNFYRQLNAAMRHADRSKATPFFVYLRLLFAALEKLSMRPTQKKSELWRGVHLDLQKDHPIGSEVTWWGASSCTPKISVAKGFLGSSGPRTLFKVQHRSAVPIKEFSAFRGEEEWLLAPGTRLRVDNVIQKPDGHCEISLAELEPPRDIR